MLVLPFRLAFICFAGRLNNAKSLSDNSEDALKIFNLSYSDH